MKEYDDNNTAEINNLEKRQKRDNTFNIIVGVSTLIIAILGATFAYFSATASSKENDVNVKSAYVSIAYDGGIEITASNLIPAVERVAIKMFKKEAPKGEDDNYHTLEEEGYAFQENEDAYTNDTARRCVDVLGREVCAVYQFSIQSEGEEGGTTEIAGGIKIEENDFTNLSYIVYEVEIETDEEGNELYDRFKNKVVDPESYVPVSTFTQTDTIDPQAEDRNPNFSYFEKPIRNYAPGVDGGQGAYISTTRPVACLFGYLTEEELMEKYSDNDEYRNIGKDDLRRCKNIFVTNQKKHNYQVLIWLMETGNNQPEQGLEFSGTVKLEVPGGTGDYKGGQITGKDGSEEP